jgi:hypothetical protein
MEEPKILIGLDFSLASQEVIELLIEDASGPEIFDEIARSNQNRPEILKLLLESPETPEDVRQFVSGFLHLPEKSSFEVAKVEKTEVTKAEKTKEGRGETLLLKIQKLNVSERIQLALRGGREMRSILLKDPNKEVMYSVLENQKISDSEIEIIARSRSVAEEVLRRITKNREWMKNYAITLALVTNPKTPAGLAVGFVSSLKKKDLKLLETNRNLSEAVRGAAKRLTQAKRPH